jgi:hypothetical protein
MQKTLYIRNKDVLGSLVDNEYVIFSSNNGEYYGLNSVASRVWESMHTPKTIQDISEELIREFDVEKEECERYVIQFVHELIEHDLAHKLSDE